MSLSKSCTLARLFLWPGGGSHCAASLPLVGTASMRGSSKERCWHGGEKQPTQASAGLYKSSSAQFSSRIKTKAEKKRGKRVKRRGKRG